jgi:hypothetical protein
MSQDIYVVVEHLRGQVLEISYVMLAAARALSKGAGGQVVAVLLGQDAQGLAKDLNADLVHSLDHPALAEFTPDAYLRVLATHLKENEPRAVLLGHTSIGMDVASGLSARLGMPLVSQCRRLEVLDGKLTFVSQICGGKIMAEGELPAPSALVTMIPGGYKAEEGQAAKPPKLVESPVPELDDLRVSLREYVEPVMWTYRRRRFWSLWAAACRTRVTWKWPKSWPRLWGAWYPPHVRLWIRAGCQLPVWWASQARRSSPSSTWLWGSAARPSTWRPSPIASLSWR